VEVDFWRRLLRLQVDLREEARLVRRAIAIMGVKAWQKSRDALVARRPAVPMSKPVSAHRLFNTRFQDSFVRAMGCGKPVLFVFAEMDPWTWIFKSEFQDLVLQPGNGFERHYSYELINAANHIFSGRESQKQLEERIVNWLRVRYPVQVTA